MTLANALGEYELTGVRMFLADAAHGHVDSDLSDGTTHVVDAGDAFFWIVGGAADDASAVERFLVSNSTPIAATHDSRTGAWTLATFALEYVDLNGDSWVIRIPSSTWDLP